MCVCVRVRACACACDYGVVLTACARESTARQYVHTQIYSSTHPGAHRLGRGTATRDAVGLTNCREPAFAPASADRMAFPENNTRDVYAPLQGFTTFYRGRYLPVYYRLGGYCFAPTALEASALCNAAMERRFTARLECVMYANRVWRSNCRARCDIRVSDRSMAIGAIYKTVK